MMEFWEHLSIKAISLRMSVQLISVVCAAKKTVEANKII